MYACWVPDLHQGRGGLTPIQAVQQVKSSDPDLEAERGQEEAAGRVQDQPRERSLLSVHCAAAKHVKTLSDNDEARQSSSSLFLPVCLKNYSICRLEGFTPGGSPRYLGPPPRTPNVNTRMLFFYVFTFNFRNRQRTKEMKVNRHKYPHQVVLCD